MTSQTDDFSGTLSSEFVLPTNGAIGASRMSGEDGQCHILAPCVYDFKVHPSRSG
jgi:hypothetical protein